MIKRIYQISDVHIRTFRDLDKYGEVLTDFIEELKEDASHFKPEEVRIVICGDLLHNKNNLTPELIVFASTFIRQLESIAKVLVIAGNHDLIESNKSRTDAISSIFQTADFSNSLLLDMVLNYESGVVDDDNVLWALYSIYDDYRRPDIESAREMHPDKKVFGLFHGSAIGTQNFNGYVLDAGVEGKVFDGCDYVLAGHIHKRQSLKYGDCEFVYGGSLIQQDYGETVSQHGYVVWNLENNTYEFKDVKNDYSLLCIEIDKPEDIDNNEEKSVNP